MESSKYHLRSQDSTFATGDTDLRDSRGSLIDTDGCIILSVLSGCATATINSGRHPLHRGDMIQACYQHACLLFEDGTKMTNLSLRERLSIGKNNSAVASRIINDTINAGLIKLADESSGSKRYSAYIPYYA